MAQLQSTTVDGTLKVTGNDVPITAKSSSTGAEISFGIGSGTVNRGIFDWSLNKWIIYTDGTNVRLGNSSKTYSYGVNKVLWSGAYYNECISNSYII